MGLAMQRLGRIARRQGYILRRRFRFSPVQGVFEVSWKSLVILLAVILGIVLFLYGANYYNAISGWSGVFLIFAGIIAYLALEAYEALRKRGA
jgi:hypothetical protein